MTYMALNHSPFAQARNRALASSTAALLLLLCSCRTSGPGATAMIASEPRSFPPGLADMRLHTESNRLYDACGVPVWLRGLNLPSLEWTNRGEHIIDSIKVVTADWKANLIRLPLSQDYRFGKTPDDRDGGRTYRAIVDRAVECRLRRQSLHCARTPLVQPRPMGLRRRQGGRRLCPDQLSVVFWNDLATRYKNHPAVIFGVYNEPHDVSWKIWREGGTVQDLPAKWNRDQARPTYEAVGLQKLYDTVRAVGAENVITVAGLDWGYDLRGVTNGYALQATNCIYETHPYRNKKNWDANFGGVCRVYPDYIGEFGGGPNDLDYGREIMDYAKAHQAHWSAWCFHPQAGPRMLKNWSYEPTVFGQFVKDTLAATPTQFPVTNTP